MKNIYFLFLILSFGIFIAVPVLAETPALLYMLPNSLSEPAGNTFNISLMLSSGTEKVCALQGKLVFNDLSCQNIKIAEGLSVQTAPTCDNPHFVVGIPKCLPSGTIKDIFSISVKGTRQGQAGSSIMNVQVVGEGVDVAFGAQGAVYDITKPLPKSSVEDAENQQSTKEENQGKSYLWNTLFTPQFFFQNFLINTIFGSVLLILIIIFIFLRYCKKRG